MILKAKAENLDEFSMEKNFEMLQNKFATTLKPHADTTPVNTQGLDKSKNPTPPRRKSIDSDNQTDEMQLWGDERERLESIKSVDYLKDN